MTGNFFHVAYFSPDIACLVATFQNGEYLDVLAIQHLVIPPHLARNTFPHDEYAVLAATLDPWLSEHGVERLPRLFDSLDDMHIIMLLYAAYSGRVDVVQRALTIRAATPAILLLMVDVAAWNNQRPVLDYLVSLPHEDGWTCSSFALIAASKGGHLDNVRFLHERFPLVPTTEDAMDMAAAEGHLDVVRYLHAHRQEGCTTRAMDGAAKNGHLDVLRFLHANRSEGCTQNAMDWACEHGHLEVAQWLHEHRRWEGLTENAFNGAAANNHLSVVEFLHHVVRAPSTIKATDKAAAAGHWAMVKWIHDHRPVLGWTDKALKIAAGLGFLDGNWQVIDPNRCDAAARRGYAGAIESGDLKALEWFVTHRPDDCSVHDAMKLAVSYGKVDVIRWLKTRGAELYIDVQVACNACNKGYLDVVKMLHEHDPNSLSPQSFGGAAGGGHLDVVEWLYDQGVVQRPSECDALDQAASFGHLHVVQWLHVRSFPATVVAMDGAAARGHLEVVRWLHKHRQEGCTQTAVENAASNGHFSVVRWLIRHRRLRPTSYAMGWAADNGDLAMLEFMCNDDCEPLEAEVMDQAASSGHLGILLFLHAHHMGRCTRDAFYESISSGHFQVAKWLHATYGFDVTRDVLNGAIRNGDLVAMRWLLMHWQGGVPNVEFESMYMTLTMVQFLLEMGSVCSVGSLYYAAYNGYLAMLIKMHEFGATCVAETLRVAATNGHVDVVRWLFANRTEGCAEGAIDGVAVMWSSLSNFMANEFVPATPLAMIEAAQRGDLAVVEWLYDRGSWSSRDRFVRQVDMSSVVAWAADHPNLDTAQWILNKTKSRKRKADS